MASAAVHSQATPEPRSGKFLSLNGTNQLISPYVAWRRGWSSLASVAHVRDDESGPHGGSIAVQVSVYGGPMDTRSAPARLRSQASWLINQNSVTAHQLVAGRLASAGAHRYHYSMLAALEEFGPASQAALGRRSGLDRSDVAAAVTDLAQRQLVERAADPVDRRRNIVRITPAGLRYLRTLDQLIAAAQDELLEPLPAGERQQLVALLTRLADHHAPLG